MTSERLSGSSLPCAPLAPVQLHKFVLHGRALADPYAWLKAENWREVLKDPGKLPASVREHLDQENAYTRAVLQGSEPLQQRLVQEMRGRIKEDDATVPQPDGPFAYFTRFREGGQHPLICREPRGGGAAAVLIDGDKEGEGKPFFQLGDASHSPDHALMAWSADFKGSEFFTIRLRDLSAGTDLEDAIPNAAGAVVWAADSEAFFYVELDDNHRPVRVRRHRLGRPVGDDEVAYEESDPGFFVDIAATQSNAYVVISASDHETSEAWLIDRADRDARARCIERRTPQVQYRVEHHGKQLIILTNADGAEDFKLVTAPVTDPGRANWRELVPHRPGTMILSHVALSRHLLRLERQDANPQLIVRDIETGSEQAIAFEDEAYSLALDTGYEFDTDLVRFRYSSMTTPTETIDYRISTGGRTLRKRQEIPSGHDPDSYRTRRLFAEASDGQSIPVSLVHRRGLNLDGSAPCLLYGYGSYGTSIPASFRTNLLSLVDRGFVYAIAHVRGGTEKGWGWYTSGKREQKSNTFTDFIACGEALAAAGYTARGRIVAHGGSAGGMVMGAVANLAPDLFGAIIADVPFVDVLNTMLDGSLPLTPPEWPEWGNPAADEGAFRTLLGYSPYENVRRQDYPPILALGGLTDPRVTYWEPAKWVARLRATMTGGGPILLRINMDAGHGGAAGRFDRLEEVALSYAFALQALDGFVASSG